jgi:hypothetical protein
VPLRGGMGEASSGYSLFEAEQLLLAPDESDFPLESLELFGLKLGYMQVGTNTECVFEIHHTFFILKPQI